MIRRLLDLLHLADYPMVPVSPHVFRGAHAHVGSEFFVQMREAGFDTVGLDIVPDYAWYDYEALFNRAKAAGLKILTGLFPLLPADEKKGRPAPIMPPDPQAYAREVFQRFGHQLDFVGVLNEGNLDRFYRGTIEELAEITKAVNAERVVHARHVQLLSPNLSPLGSSSREGWRDKEYIIHRLAERGAADATQLISLHIYSDSPDAAMRDFEDAVKMFRFWGWRQPFFVSEIGFQSKGWRGRRQADYLGNVLGRLSKHPDVAAFCIYELKDAPPDPVTGKTGTYGLRRAEGQEKESWRRVKGALKA